jgi:hypothetical protein
MTVSPHHSRTGPGSGSVPPAPEPDPRPPPRWPVGDLAQPRKGPGRDPRSPQAPREAGAPAALASLSPISSDMTLFSAAA